MLKRVQHPTARITWSRISHPQTDLLENLGNLPRVLFQGKSDHQLTRRTSTRNIRKTKMANNEMWLVDATTAPERLPGIRILGFECCHCNGVSFTNSLGKCDDEQCSHERCRDCTVIDRAGRLWDKKLGVSIHWLCQCGSTRPVIDTLVVNETGKLAKPVCLCQKPAFVAMYSTYGRLCSSTKLSIVLPFALNTVEDVQTLVAELDGTSYGPCLRVERETKNVAKKGDLPVKGYVNEEWDKASKFWNDADMV